MIKNKPTTVGEIIEKLKKYDLNLPAIIEPNIDYRNAESNYEQAYNVFHENTYPILIREAVAQHHVVKKDAEGNLYDEEVYIFDELDPAPDDKRVVVISSTSLKYGSGT